MEPNTPEEFEDSLRWRVTKTNAREGRFVIFLTSDYTKDDRNHSCQGRKGHPAIRRHVEEVVEGHHPREPRPLPTRCLTAVSGRQ